MKRDQSRGRERHLTWGTIDSNTALPLRELYAPPAPGGPANLLLEGDNLPLLQSLCDGALRDFTLKAGGLKLVYLDPPFAVGSDFYTDSALGPHKCLAYRDSWPGGLDGYLDMMRARLSLTRRALADDGCLFLHCDSRVSHHLRLMLDEIFGPERFLGEIIWHYTGGGRARRWFSRKHDSIFHYAVSERWHFDPDAVRVPYKKGSGYARSGITSAAGKRYLPHPDGSPVDDVWDIAMVNPLARERSGYPTQKPLALLERILAACSRPGDLVADFFCGSGTLALAAARLGRRFICADQSPLAVQTTKLRLLEQNFPDFAVAAMQSGPPQSAIKSPAWLEAVLPSGPLRYLLEPRVRLENRGPDLRVHLEDVKVSLEAERADPDLSRSGRLSPGSGPELSRSGPHLPRSGPHLPQSGPAWLRAWGLSLFSAQDCGPGLSVDARTRLVLWRATSCQKRAIALCSPKLRQPVAALALDLEDIFGNSLCLPLADFAAEKNDE